MGGQQPDVSQGQEVQPPVPPPVDPNVFFQLGYGARGTSTLDDITKRAQAKEATPRLTPEDVPAVVAPTDRTGIAAPTEKLPPLDPNDLKVVDGVLEVKYDNKNFDRILQEAKGYESLRITNMPKGVELRHWVDNGGPYGGNYFWFRFGHDGNKHHYFPPALRNIEINGNVQDLGKERLLVGDAYANKTVGGFGSWEKTTSPVTYFMKMSQNAEGAMSVLEKSMTDAMQTSNNPYYKIYLSDIYTAQAILAIPAVNVILANAGDLRNPDAIRNLNAQLSALQSRGGIQTDNPATLKKMNDAITLLDQVTHDSDESLKQVQRFPAKNVYTPMDPYKIYDDPRSDAYYYSFWGGSLDQARHRQVALTFMRDLVNRGALKFELPPMRSPR